MINYWNLFPVVYENVVFIAQSSVTLCNPMDCSPPGSSVHGILQARILEWVAIPFSRECSQPRDRTWVPLIAGRFFTIWATSCIWKIPKYSMFIKSHALWIGSYVHHLMFFLSTQWGVNNYVFHLRGKETEALRSVAVVAAQSLSGVWHFATPWTAAHGSSVFHYLLEFVQIHVHWVDDAV